MSKWQGLEQELKDSQIQFTCDELLSLHTSFKIGGPADILCLPKNIEQLKKAVELCKKNQLRFYILGKGSNSLFADSGFRGVIICTSKMENTINVAANQITVSCGAPLVQVCLAAQKAGLSGLEFAYGIPGSVGGAVYMNAGAYGGEMKNILLSASYLDSEGEIKVLSNEDMALGYRTSIFSKNQWCILEVKLQLAYADTADIKARMDDLMARRREKQPLEYPSAGSTFKRPEGAFAGELIQRCGLRGFRVGDAAISEKHCGFVINLGKASCRDVLKLTELVKNTVQEKTGYVLEKEIRVIE